MNGKYHWTFGLIIYRPRRTLYFAGRIIAAATAIHLRHQWSSSSSLLRPQSAGRLQFLLAFVSGQRPKETLTTYRFPYFGLTADREFTIGHSDCAPRILWSFAAHTHSELDMLDEIKDDKLDSLIAMDPETSLIESKEAIARQDTRTSWTFPTMHHSHHRM